MKINNFGTHPTALSIMCLMLCNLSAMQPEQEPIKKVVLSQQEQNLLNETTNVLGRIVSAVTNNRYEKAAMLAENFSRRFVGIPSCQGEEDLRQKAKKLNGNAQFIAAIAQRNEQQRVEDEEAGRQYEPFIWPGLQQEEKKQ